MSENRTDVRPSKGKKKFSKKGKKITKREVAKIARNVLTRKTEKHYYDVNNTGLVSSSGSIIPLSGLSAGTSDQQRIGDNIEVTSLNVRMQWYYGDETNICRCIVFQWLNSDATAPVPNQIIQSDILGFVGAPSGQYSKDNCGYNWVPLVDKTITLAGVSPNSISQSSVKLMEMTITNKDLKKGKRTPHLQYLGGGTTGTGMLYMLLISDSTVAFPHPTVYWDARLRFLA